MAEKKISEKQVEDYLRLRAKQLGGKAYKFVSPGNAGVPDRIVVLPGRVPVFVELKAADGKLTKLQERKIEELRKLGQLVFVLHSREGVDIALACIPTEWTDGDEHEV